LGAPRRPVAVSGIPDGVVLYDGICVLCSFWFRFVVRRDPGARFRFAQIQGSYGQALAGRLGIDPNVPETNVFITADVAYFRSDAPLQILRRLPGWRWTGVLLAVPRPVRDWLYDRVARNRYRLFGRTETCLMPSAELKRHVFDEPAHGPCDGIGV